MRRAGTIEHDASRLRVVGIGASTGGLDAFFELLKHLPDDAGCRFPHRLEIPQPILAA
jgi:chemotaxis response regulator CheB